MWCGPQRSQAPLSREHHYDAPAGQQVYACRQHIPAITVAKTDCDADGRRSIIRYVPPVLDIAACGDRPSLSVRAWLPEDMPLLVAAVALEDPENGPESRLESNLGVDVLGRRLLTGPRSGDEAALWLSGQERGWQDGDWLTFAVVHASQRRVVGHVTLKNRDGGQVGVGHSGEIGYWTAADVRGRGIAPAAVRAVTHWAFTSFGAARLPRIMLVHDVGNLASCRVAEKSGYPFRELSPARPPYWFTDGHIHLAEASAGW
jgi:RimJ/RimL family protein N-acetyltransferase